MLVAFGFVIVILSSHFRVPTALGPMKGKCGRLIKQNPALKVKGGNVIAEHRGPAPETWAGPGLLYLGQVDCPWASVWSAGHGGDERPRLPGTVWEAHVITRAWHAGRALQLPPALVVNSWDHTVESKGHVGTGHREGDDRHSGLSPGWGGVIPACAAVSCLLRGERETQVHAFSAPNSDPKPESPSEETFVYNDIPHVSEQEIKRLSKWWKEEEDLNDEKLV